MFPYALNGTATLRITSPPSIIVLFVKLKTPTALLTVKVALAYASA